MRKRAGEVGQVVTQKINIIEGQKREGSPVELSNQDLTVGKTPRLKLLGSFHEGSIYVTESNTVLLKTKMRRKNYEMNKGE